MSEGIQIPRARVIVSGDPVSKLSYVFQADLHNSPYLLDAAITWTFSREWAITAGQFKIPFGTESLIADNLDIPITRARAVNSLSPGRDTGVQARDVGLQLAGALYRDRNPVLEYAAGVFRGQTVVEAPRAHYPAVAARLMVRPTPVVSVGGDWYSSFSSAGGMDKRSEEAEGSVHPGPMLFRAEQIWARDGGLDRRGGYALAACRLSLHWEPLARADWLTTNTHKANATSIAYIAGLNFYWRKHVKVGANAGAQHDQGPKRLGGVFLIETTLGF